MESFRSTFTIISSSVFLLVNSTHHTTAENHIWTTILEQHIRSLDLAHVLGGGNLLGDVTKKRAVYDHGSRSLRLSVLALIHSCASGRRCNKLHRKHIGT